MLMASYRFITLAIVAIVLPAVATATEHIVGDDYGWDVEYDYVVWAKNQTFLVGDTLVFRYMPAYHNVIKVNATESIDCTSSSLEVPLNSGNDVITLSTPGRKWYICGKVGLVKHCVLGQKLVIDVLADAPAPSPAPSAPASSPTPSAPPSPPTPSSPPSSHKNAASGVMSFGSPTIVAAIVLIMAVIMT